MTLDPHRWNNRLAIVTGASEGIGRAIADLILERGGTVIGIARREDPLRAWADAHPPDDDGAERAIPVIADVATPEGRGRLLDAVAARGGRLDALINNVGTNIRRPTTAYTEAEVRTLLETNLLAALELTRALHPALAASGAAGRGPAVVNVSSVASRVSVGTGVVYAATKAAIDQMTRYLAVEWGPPGAGGIRVNAVNPWYIRTPLAAPVLADPARLDAILGRTPAGRIGEPREVGEAVLFLASPGASYITGQCLAVDGGMLAVGL